MIIMSPISQDAVSCGLSGLLSLFFYGGSIRVIHALIASLSHLRPKTSLHLIVNGIT